MRSLTTKMELEGVKPSHLQRQKRRNKRWSKELKNGYTTRSWCSSHGSGRGQLKNYESKLGYENVPQKLSIKFIHNKLIGNYKYSNSHLRPLKRFLKTNVGQNWDKIYAELTQKIDRRSRVGQHWIEQIFNYVETDTTIIDGKVFRSNGTPLFRNRWHGGRLQLYVHPVSRVLCRFKKNYYKRLKIKKG